MRQIVPIVLAAAFGCGARQSAPAPASSAAAPAGPDRATAAPASPDRAAAKIPVPGVGSEPGGVIARVDTTAAGELILVHEITVDAPVEAVWDAYTTAEGWRAWVAPLVEIDLRVGGHILTNYNAGGRIGDRDTNRLHIRNYVPHRLLTLQADVSKNWPAFMKVDVASLYNVILFERVSPTRTRIVSYGTGYRNTPEYKQLLDLMLPANTKFLQELERYVENLLAADLSAYGQHE